MDEARTTLDRVLVGRSSALVLLLAQLVADSAGGTADAVTETRVWCVALGLLLVGLLGSLSRLALDALRDVVGGVLDGVADLADDALIWLISVWCRHVVGRWWWVGWWLVLVVVCWELLVEVACLCWCR